MFRYLALDFYDRSNFYSKFMDNFIDFDFTSVLTELKRFQS